MVWVASQLLERMSDEQYAQCLRQLCWYCKCESRPTIDLVTDCLTCWECLCVAARTCGVSCLLAACTLLAAYLPLLLLACFAFRWASVLARLLLRAALSDLSARGAALARLPSGTPRVHWPPNTVQSHLSHVIARKLINVWRRFTLIIV